MNIPIAIVLIVTASCLNWIDASAATASERSQLVEYSDLDLSVTQGAATLYERLHSAARKVCRDAGADPVRRFMRFNGCVSKTTANAIAQIDSDLLSAYAANRTGRRSRNT